MTKIKPTPAAPAPIVTDAMLAEARKIISVTVIPLEERIKRVFGFAMQAAQPVVDSEVARLIEAAEAVYARVSVEKVDDSITELAAAIAAIKETNDD